LVEFPTKDNWSVGFVTNETFGKQFKAVKPDLLCVFIPFALSPFTGYIMLISKQRIHAVDISVDEALKFIVSAGVVS
jgi:uncharacterized membrane protein